MWKALPLCEPLCTSRLCFWASLAEPHPCSACWQVLIRCFEGRVPALVHEEQQRAASKAVKGVGHSWRQSRIERSSRSCCSEATTVLLTRNRAISKRRSIYSLIHPLAEKYFFFSPKFLGKLQFWEISILKTEMKFWNPVNIPVDCFMLLLQSPIALFHAVSDQQMSCSRYYSSQKIRCFDRCSVGCITLKNSK